MKLFGFLAAAVLMACSVSASASTINVGLINSSRDFTITPPDTQRIKTGQRADTFAISILEADAPVTVTINDLSGVEQYVFTLNAGQSSGAFTLGTSSSRPEFDLVFSGSGSEVLANISAVPIPAAAWLFGTALIGMGVISRRRRAGIEGFAA